jgi:c-di-GMP-binding flagellar brake protein YcgR
MHRRGAERRRFVRIDDEVVASVERTGAPGKDGRTLNFSAGGVLMLLDEYIDQGSDLSVALSFDDDTVVRFAARVVRIRTLSDRTHEIAAEFIGGSAEEQRRLQEQIARRTHDAPSPPPLSA